MEKDFSPDSIKQAGNKIVSNNLRPLYINKSQVKISESHKYMSVILGSNLIFKELLYSKTNKCNKSVDSIEKLSLILWKTYLSEGLYYADIIYNKPGNKSIKYWVAKTQYDATLAITGAIRGISWEVYHGSESLADRQ